MIKHVFTLSVALDGATLPTEFRLFAKGWNDSEKGKFLFDDKAAKSVMAAYASWGVDLMIDLEHQSLEVEGGAPDPTARDARGWCKLEVRNGELWACDVKWTPDGAARLQNKTQRYVSPAFDADPKTRRVLKMFNVAITAMPATHKTPALVAASASGENSMNKDLVEAALEAIQEGDDAKATEILKGMIASAASGEPGEGDDAGSADDGAEGVAPPKETESVEEPKQVDESAPEMDDEDEEKDEKKKMSRRSLRAMLGRLTGKRTLAEAVAEVDVFRASHMTLESERQKLAAATALIESAERRKLVVELVTLGAEFPSTVWSNDKSKTMKPRWAKMPLVELRAHVADQRTARGAKKPAPGYKPPAGEEPSEAFGLSAEELAICKSMNCEPKAFAALKAHRDGKKGN